MAKSKTSMDPEFAVLLCHQFEQEWSPDKKTNLKSFLKKVDKAHRGEAFTMLLEIEIDRRNSAGQQVDPEDYVKFGDGAYQLVKKLIARGPKYDETEAREPQQTSKLAIHFKSDQIGPYKLLEEIGSGGMGMVWVAEQAEPVYRKVALKLVKPELGSSELIARFDAERQALAMMDHPNIAKFLDAGTTDEGTPYFAMELVQGTPINKFCDRNQVSIHDRLQMFISVCRAVQHAHQKGIIHRDLKPTNILVQMEDGVPTPKVIDFGLAKALDQTQKLTDKTLFTEFGHVIGTIQYMSPEQATLDAMGSDSRSDIYSLGVVLFELLVGSTPIDRKTVKENAFLKILELVREKEPPRPSARLMESGERMDEILENRCIQIGTYRQILESDLDWVVVKALEKDPGRRYETASLLGRELERIIDGEPIEARPPSVSYRLGKFVKKNRIMVGSSVAGVSLVLFFLVITSFLALRATDFRIASERAESELQAAEKERDVAIRRYKDLITENQKSNSRKQPPEDTTRSATNPNPLPQTKSIPPGKKVIQAPPKKADPTLKAVGQPTDSLFDEILELQLERSFNERRPDVSRLKTILQKLPADQVIRLLDAMGISQSLITTANSATRRYEQETADNRLGMKFKLIPAGTLVRGKEQINFDIPFYMGVHEVTVAQFREFIKDSIHETDSEKNKLKTDWRNPGFPQNDNHPVINLDYWDANAFCKWLSQDSDHYYRLPRRDEWEYGCRAGVTTLFQNGDDPGKLSEVANVAGKADGYEMTAPVGSYAPNAFGLYDMHGNAMEWTDDSARPNSQFLRVRRGGSYSSGAPWTTLQISHRLAEPSEKGRAESGFRVVREVKDSDLIAVEEVEEPTEREKADQLIKLLGVQYELQLSGKNSIVGEWIPADPADNDTSIAKLVISSIDKEQASVNVWKTGQHQTGPAKLKLVGDSNSGATRFWYGFASWTFGFKVKYLIIKKAGTHLEMELFDIFTDDSGRSHYRRRCRMKKSSG